VPFAKKRDNNKNLFAVANKTGISVQQQTKQEFPHSNEQKKNFRASTNTIGISTQQLGQEVLKLWMERNNILMIYLPGGRMILKYNFN
jgi:hypothetical protein